MMSMERKKGTVCSLFLFLAAVCLLSPARAQAQTCDLAAAQASIKVTQKFTYANNQICATVKNTSTTCTFPVALETFNIDPNNFSLNAQTFIAADIRQGATALGPGQEVTLCSPAGPCATQADIMTDFSGSTVFPITQLSDLEPNVAGRNIIGELFGCFCPPLPPPPPPPGMGCTLTQGFYKNHPSALPDSLQLGMRTYTRAQLTAILKRAPSGGNCLVILAHQLIAAKANIIRGASAPSGVTAAITTADMLIGSRDLLKDSVACSSDSRFSATSTTLDNYNNGKIGPGHCDDDDDHK